METEMPHKYDYEDASPARDLPRRFDAVGSTIPMPTELQHIMDRIMGRRV